MTGTDQTTAMLAIPEPLLSVTPTGIHIEWHAHGLNIEVRIRETGSYALIEDRDGVVPTYSGNDSGAIGRALSALCVLEGRSNG